MLLNYFISITCIVGLCQAIPASLQQKLHHTNIAREVKTVPVLPSGILVGDCGSLGRISEVRVSGCEQAPCELHPGESYVIEVDFSTSANGDSWDVVVTAFAGSSSVVVLDENVEAEIEAGDWHTLQYELPVTDLFLGLDISVQIQLIEANTKVQEVCISAAAFVTEPESTTPQIRF